MKYLRKNPNLIRYLKHLIIGVDLHFTFLLNNMEQLRSTWLVIVSRSSNFLSLIWHMFYAADI